MVKKRIVFIVAEFFKGGAERYAYEIDRVLDKTKFEITVLCLNNINQKVNDWERFYDKKHLELGTKVIFFDVFLNSQNEIINRIKKKLKLKTKGRINHAKIVSFLSGFDVLHWMGEYTFYHELPENLLRKSIVNTMSAKFQNPNLYSKFNFDKNYTMRGDSNLTLYIVAGIIIGHFLIGFIYLIYKMNKKK